MIKQLVHWKGPDQKPKSRTFYFDLTEYELAGEMQLEVLYARFQKFQDEVVNSTPAGEDRQMTPPEIRELLDMIKVIIRHAYGEFVDGPDGAEMRKEQEYPEIWKRFVSTGGFNAVIWYLFEDANRANKFMEEIWPESYKNRVAANLTVVPDQPDQPEPSAFTDEIPSLEDEPVGEVLAPSNKPWYEYTKPEMDSLSDSEFDGLVERSKQGNNVPAQLLVIAGQRKNREPVE